MLVRSNLFGLQRFFDENIVINQLIYPFFQLGPIKLHGECAERPLGLHQLPCEQQPQHPE